MYVLIMKDEKLLLYMLANWKSLYNIDRLSIYLTIKHLSFISLNLLISNQECIVYQLMNTFIEIKKSFTFNHIYLPIIIYPLLYQLFIFFFMLFFLINFFFISYWLFLTLIDWCRWLYISTTNAKRLFSASLYFTLFFIWDSLLFILI